MIRRLARLALALWAAGSMALAGYVLAQIGAVLAALVKLALRRTLRPRRAVANGAGFAP